MKEQKIIGIDVSKGTLDCCYLNGNLPQFIQIENNVKGFKILEKWLTKTFDIQYQDAIFCMEHTGLYNLPLIEFLRTKQTSIWLESAIHIKRSIGLIRGKNDKVDAERIAKYALKNIDKIKLWQPKRFEIEKIKALVTLREGLISQVKQMSVSVNEYNKFGDKNIAKSLTKHTSKLEDYLRKQILKIENEINQVINEDKDLAHLFEILTSVPGVGQVTAWMIIVYTNEFKMITTPKSLACHSGIAPFEHSSGLSRGKSKVSHLANKKLKTALHMASLSAIKYDNELKAFYNRKVAEGKNKMSVLNAIRNKIVHRVFACQKNNRLFVKKIA